MTTPHSIEAEKSVLCCFIADSQESGDQCVTDMKIGHFYHMPHQYIFAELVMMKAKNLPIDLITLMQWMTDRSVLETAGGGAYLVEILNQSASPKLLGSYIRIVLAKAKLRECLQSIFEIKSSVDSGTEPEEVVEHFLKNAFSLIEKQASTEVPFSQLIEAYEEKYNVISKSKNGICGINTPYPQLTALTGGFGAGDMIVIAARPSVGKTAMCLGIAKQAASQRWSEEKEEFIKPGHPVGILSLEMSKDQIAQRLISVGSGSTFESVKSYKMEGFDQQRFSAAREMMQSWPIYIDDCSTGCTITQARAKARKMKNLYGIDMLIIDYMQIMRDDSEQSRGNREREISSISAGCKAIAKELNIPVVVLAQLNRQGEQTNAEPGLHSLRESGSIEQDADLVILLHRHDLQRRNSIKAIVAKQRNGPTGSFMLNFAPDTQTFLEESQPTPKNQYEQN